MVQKYVIASMLLIVIAAPIAAEEKPAGINQKLRAELRPLAQSLRAIVAEEKQTSISIGDFIRPPDFDTNFGPGLQLLLSEELELLEKGIVKPKSDLFVTGKYAYVSAGADNPDQRVIKISVDVQRGNGELISKLARNIRDEPRLITDNEVIAAIIAPGAVELPVQASKKRLNEIVRKQAEEPKFMPAGSRVRANVESPFGVELLVAKNAQEDVGAWKKIKPRDVIVDKDNRPAVEIARGEFYALGLYNETKHSVAVTVNIDGVDVFAFSEFRVPVDAKFPTGKPKYSHFIIPPGGAIIPGWHRNNQKSASFEVTAYGEGASKLLKLDSTRPGVITVSFALAWKGDEVPEEEKNVRRSTSGNETGFGPDIKNKLEEIQMNFGVVREIVSVRYSR